MQPTDQNEKWLRIAANLRVDRKDNIAPRKPLLLLVVAELSEQGKLERILPLTGELVFRFLAFWTVVAHRRSQKPNIRLPFYHMRNDGCWTPLNENGEPTLERMRVTAAQFDESFIACLHDPTFRKQLRRVLIARYFTDPGERAALYDLVGLPVPPEHVVKSDAQLYQESRERGREARFRLTVVPAYNYTCALTGYLCSQTRELGEGPSSILRRLLNLHPPTRAASAVPGSPGSLESRPIPPSPPGPKTAMEASENNRHLLEFVHTWTPTGQPQALGRFLSLLSWLHQSHGEGFGVVGMVRGRRRVYFAKAPEEIKRTGSSTLPKAIPGTPWYVATNTSTRLKQVIVRKVMCRLGYTKQCAQEVAALIEPEPNLRPDR
jgi:negative regulator of replication initiation